MDFLNVSTSPVLFTMSQLFNTNIFGDIQIWYALLIIFSVWIINWGRSHLPGFVGWIVGFALVYLTIWTHPTLVWLVAAIIFLSIFGEGIRNAVGLGGD
ncbi:MAG: hypothetical protein J7K00_04805 [Candidatus Diapherotrites archaeon]|nr:hypothetical protein [Candidatus Diapherotrites archaeon]